MNKKRVHTPEGVRDVYGIEYRRRSKLKDKLKHVFAGYGYEGIRTPGFEFFDVFNSEKGTVSSREMYKFFDREGNTLVLRPDVTPSIARCVAKYFSVDKNDLSSNKRSNEIAFPRQIAMYLCREVANMSYPKIGEDFGNRDHSTVMHACKKIENEIKEKNNTRLIVESVKNIIINGEQ